MKNKKLFYEIALAVNNNQYIMVIKNSSLSLLPIIIVLAFSSLIMTLLGTIWAEGYNTITYDVLSKVKVALTAVFPYTLVYLISQGLNEIRKKQVGLLTRLAPVLSLLIFNSVVDGSLIFGPEIKFLRAIIVGIFSYELYSFLNKKLENRTILKFGDFRISSNSFMQIFISILNISIISLLSYGFHASRISLDMDPSKNMIFSNSIWIALKYTFAITIPWFIGINGGHVVTASYEKLYRNFVDNQNAIETGLGNLKFIDQSFYNLYVHIGGSGATICLLLALFLSKKRHNKSFAKLALFPSIFNINEIIIFGLPIVANIQLLVPFLLVPLLFTCLSYGALSLGLIPVVTTEISWITPPLINGLIAGNGDLRVILWQLFLILLGTLIYIYFLKKYDKSNNVEFGENFNFLNRENLNGNLGESQLNIFYEVQEAKENVKNLLHKGKFILYFQPILDKNNRVEKLEALLRIDHEDKGIIPPYFLKYFKTLKLLNEIDYWVIDEAFKHQKLLLEKGIVVKMSINISAETFGEKQFVETLKNTLHKYEIKAPSIVLELVEEVCLYDLENAKRKISELKEIGFHISIDDFGTGYSSLSYLLDLNVDFIKVDRKFVLGLDETRGKKLMQNIIELSKGLGFDTVIEGVETREQLGIVREYGTDYIQGYYFSKPEDFEKTIQYLVLNSKKAKD